jgi:uncharacterized protein (UPF0335 family)
MAIANNRVRHFADRIRSLEEERRGLAEDVKGVLLEAEKEGIDPKALRKALQLARMDSMVRASIYEYTEQLTLELQAAA